MEIEISVNDNNLKIAADSIVSDLLTNLNYQNTKGIAVALNGEVLAKDEWRRRVLKSKDKVIIITATQGG